MPTSVTGRWINADALEDAPHQVYHWIDGVCVGTSSAPIRITYTDGTTQVVQGRVSSPTGVSYRVHTSRPFPFETEPETEEERARRQEQEEAWREQERERGRAERQAMEAASNRARELLFRHITLEQRRCFMENEHFDVVAADGATYRLCERRSENIFKLDENGENVEGWCIHPREMVPVCDQLLAQKLMLESGDPSFFEIGVRFWERVPETPSRNVFVASLGGSG